MVWAKRAAAQIRLGRCAPSKPANSPTQMATIRAKKSCPSDAWAMVAHAGVIRRTATPPSAACARTTATAAQASLAATEESLPNGRGSEIAEEEETELRSDWQAEARPTKLAEAWCMANAKPTVSRPTSIAVTRCANS